MLEDGELRRHTRKARRIYAARRDFLANELIHELGDHVFFNTPAGGLAIWLGMRPGLSAVIWASNAARAGLTIAPGLRFTLNAAKPPEAFRIGYVDLDEANLRRVVTLLADSCPIQ
jgi:GntR family transcriptional regulator / MocR family aminotransferase